MGAPTQRPRGGHGALGALGALAWLLRRSAFGAAAAGLVTAALLAGADDPVARGGSWFGARPAWAGDASVDALDAQGTTALGRAAIAGDGEAMRRLLDAGAAVDGGASPARAPVALAVAHGHVEDALLLLEHGSAAGRDPALAAALLRALVDNGTAAAAATLVPRVEELVESSPDVRAAMIDALVAAPGLQSGTMLKVLEPLSGTRDFATALLAPALAEGRFDLATFAIARGADVNSRHETLGPPLAIALRRSDSELVRLLVSAGADWRAEGIDRARVEDLAADVLEDRSSIAAAAAAGRLDDAGPDGDTRLFRAARRGDLDAVRILLEAGADPRLACRRRLGGDGWTPLMIAAAGGHAEIVRVLLAAGAEATRANAAGRTALFFAVLYSRAAVVRQLLEAGDDPDRRDASGQSALEVGEAVGDEATLVWLRKHSVDFMKRVQQATAEARPSRAAPPRKPATGRPPAAPRPAARGTNAPGTNVGGADSIDRSAGAKGAGEPAARGRDTP